MPQMLLLYTGVSFSKDWLKGNIIKLICYHSQKVLFIPNQTKKENSNLAVKLQEFLMRSSNK